MGFSHSKQITFQAFDQYVEASNSYPVPSSSLIPNWYKQLPRYVNSSDKPIKALGSKDLKMCVPFRDALIAGYLITLPCDIEVRTDVNNDIHIFHNPTLTFQVIEKRGPLLETNQGFGMPHPIGTVPIMFAWSPLYGIGTNKGYSVLVTHPLNRHDLPFVTTSGVVDSDVFDKAGNIPFFIKEGFTGIIEKGTPIAQVIPFKREEWVSQQKPSDRLGYSLFMTLRDTYLDSFYGRFLRQRKTYK